MTKVKVSNLEKRFGEIVALKEVSFEINNGEYVTIIGPSGCGKTTLIKCLAGIHRPTKGEIYFDGKLVNDLPFEERGIGYVFQEIALFPHMNVWDNVTYSPRVKDWPRDRAFRTGQELLELIQLSAREKAYPGELSGGAQQKTGLARALASESNLLILDEPLGSLDAKVRVYLRYQIKDLVRDLGLTAIHITHDQDEAMSIADRVFVMKAGRLVEMGEPNVLYTRPENLFTANFIGEANFYEGTVTKITNGRRFVDSFGLLWESSDRSKKEGEKVVAVIRPDFIAIEKIGSEKERLTGYIENYDFEGNTVRYEITLPDHRLIKARIPQLQEGLLFNIGEEVSLQIKPENVLLYDLPEKGLPNELALE